MLSAMNSGDEGIKANHMVAHEDENPGCVKAVPPAEYQYQIKDSGERQHFDSGAQRDTQKGKGRYDLLPTRALRRLACHYEGGAYKYGDDNWLKGMPMKRFAESAMRHLCKALEGLKDEDHWTAAAWNILAIVEYQERIASGLMNPKWDDLPRVPRMWSDAGLNPEPVTGGPDFATIHKKMVENAVFGVQKIPYTGPETSHPEGTPEERHRDLAAKIAFKTGDRVTAIVDNPSEADNLPAGSCGTVVLVVGEDWVSWDNWKGGWKEQEHEHCWAVHDEEIAHIREAEQPTEQEYNG